MKATWNGSLIAESDHTIVVENNHYFPPAAVKKEFLTTSATHSICPWKGEASYFNVEVDGKVNKDAAWYYPTPRDAAKNIENHIAFWKGVEVSQ